MKCNDHGARQLMQSHLWSILPLFLVTCCFVISVNSLTMLFYSDETCRRKIFYT